MNIIAWLYNPTLNQHVQTLKHIHFASSQCQKSIEAPDSLL